MFNGNGHTISGMYVNEKTPDGLFANPKPAGLFAYISGAIVCSRRIEKSVGESKRHAEGYQERKRI